MPGTDLEQTGSSAHLALRPDQTRWDDDQLAVLRHSGIPKNTQPADLQVFLYRCQQLRLDPFAGQIHLVDYGGKPTIQVGIHGWEKVALDASTTDGPDYEWADPAVEWCGPDGEWRDVWLPDGPPHAARATLLRGGRRFTATCLFREFVGQKKVYEGPGRDAPYHFETNSMWTTKPAHMLAKCCRAGALRMAFPAQFSDVRLPEELGERPATVRGDLVREDTVAEPQSPVLADWLSAVEAAATRDDLAVVWEQVRSAPGLTVTQRAHIRAACAQAAAALATATATGEETADD